MFDNQPDLIAVYPITSKFSPYDLVFCISSISVKRVKLATSNFVHKFIILLYHLRDENNPKRGRNHGHVSNS